MLNTPVTPPRVPIIDPRTNLIDRAWYLFFVSLSNTAGVVLDNPDVGPSPESLIASYDAALRALAQEVETQPPVMQLPVNDSPVIDNGLLSTVAEMQKQIDGLQVQPRSEITGATGFFTTVDLKTVTVVNGIIISII
jgi:hypothetical protein